VTAQGYSATQLETVHPRRGIGVVFLGESRRRVQHALGAGHRITHGPNAGAYDYRSGRLTVELDYGEGHVDFVSTDSPVAVLYGHALREGAQRPGTPRAIGSRPVRDGWCRHRR
jgi:hypothetical protein